MGNKVGRPVNSGGGKAPNLTTEEVRRLLAVAAGGANGVRNVALVHLMLCGLRVSEPLSIRVGDVVDAKGQVQESFVLGAINTKSHRTRRVFLTLQARKAVAAHLAASGATGNDRLFPITANYTTTLIKQLMQLAGVNGTSHSLRRTAATQLQTNGVAVRHIQEVLGHSHLNTTQIYLDANPANIANAVSTLNW